MRTVIPPTPATEVITCDRCGTDCEASKKSGMARITWFDHDAWASDKAEDEEGLGSMHPYRRESLLDFCDYCLRFALYPKDTTC